MRIERKYMCNKSHSHPCMVSKATGYFALQSDMRLVLSEKFVNKSRGKKLLKYITPIHQRKERNTTCRPRVSDTTFKGALTSNEIRECKRAKE